MSSLRHKADNSLSAEAWKTGCGDLFVLESSFVSVLKKQACLTFETGNLRDGADEVICPPGAEP